jgi:hypothetical protein
MPRFRIGNGNRVSDEIKSALDDGVAIMTINRPKKRSATSCATSLSFR